MKSVLLKEIIQDIHLSVKNGSSPRIIFDLDSTLFCVSPRTEVILRELARDEEIAGQFPHVVPHLERIDVLAQEWGIRSALVRHKISATIEFFEMLRAKWSEKFFSSHYLHHDKPYPGAVEFVKRVAESGAEVFYLTGRDGPRMEEGTRRVLAQWELPMITPEHLLMKPEARRHDAEFKLESLRRLEVDRHPSWFFENEPVIINLVRPHLPSLKIILVDSVHSGRETAPTDLPKIAAEFD